jgi:hypothetical protein
MKKVLGLILGVTLIVGVISFVAFDPGTGGHSVESAAAADPGTGGHVTRLAYDPGTGGH